MNGIKLAPFKYNEWAKWYHSNCKNVLPHTKMAGCDKNGRTNSRTDCQQPRIAFSCLTRQEFGLTGAGLSLSWNSRMSWATDIVPPGSRCTASTSLNLLKTSPKQLVRVKIAITRKTSITQSPFLSVWYLGTKKHTTGSISTCSRAAIILLERI